MARAKTWLKGWAEKLGSMGKSTSLGKSSQKIRRSIPEFAAMRIAYVTHYFLPAGFAASENTYRIVSRTLSVHTDRILCVVDNDNVVCDR